MARLSWEPTLSDRTTLKGKRDYAILRLLWDNAQSRNEIVNLNVGTFALEKTLAILGKGKGTQKQVVDLSPEDGGCDRYSVKICQD